MPRSRFYRGRAAGGKVLEKSISFSVFGIGCSLPSYIAQGRYRQAEDTVRPRLIKQFEELVTGNIRLAFSSYELTEAFACILREQMRFIEAVDFLDNVWARTALKLPRPQERSVSCRLS